MIRKNKILKKEYKNCRLENCGSGFYGLGFLGALIYYIQTATGFWSGVLGILKAIIWPVFVVYKILGI